MVYGMHKNCLICLFVCATDFNSNQFAFSENTEGVTEPAQTMSMCRSCNWNKYKCYVLYILYEMIFFYLASHWLFVKIFHFTIFRVFYLQQSQRWHTSVASLSLIRERRARRKKTEKSTKTGIEFSTRFANELRIDLNDSIALNSNSFN